MRNLVIVHLESLNLMNYRMNRDKFSALREIEKKSLSFNKYFATATSTLMIIGDLLYGGLEQFEQCESLDYIPQKYIYESSLFDDLKEKGYETNIFIYPEGADRESAEERHIAGFQNKMVLVRNYEEYLNSLESAMYEDRPFALMACNYISNISLNRYAPNSQYVSGLHRWENGYRFMDKCVKDLWELLEQKNILHNTTVLFYGDHGDEYWQHSFHGGLTHAIEPYARLIWTPFWIYDDRLKKGEINKLTCTIDLAGIIKYLLFEEQKQLIIENCYERKYILSRGAYAAQPVRKETFNKAYSLTDGKYFMLVSTYGLEFYDIEMDPECQNNFLDFFVLDNQDLKFDNELKQRLTFHYDYFMNEKEIRHLKQKFYFFRNKLKAEVTKLYTMIGKEKDVSKMNFEQLHFIHK